MRTDVVEPFKGSLKGSKRILIPPYRQEVISPFFTRASGSRTETVMAPDMLNQTSTSTSTKFFSYLSSSSRAVKLLRLSYWIFMVLSCISFFIFPWYSFLAFLIPALIMLFTLEALDLSKRLLDYDGPA